MANKKRIATTVGAMALTAALAIGGTLAYLSSVTETKTNTFTSGSNVEGKIEETDWSEKHPNGWTDYKPGESTGKSPVVTLEADSEEAYTAMKLTFKDNSGNFMPYDKFTAYVSHDGISGSWELIAKNGNGEELYFHKTAVAAGASTNPIFTNVTVNAGIQTNTESTTTEYFHRVVETDANGNIIRDEIVKTDEVTDGATSYFMKDAEGNLIAVGAGTLPKFEIGVKGYAIQTAEVDVATAKAELIKLANANTTASSGDYFTATN